MLASTKRMLYSHGTPLLWKIRLKSWEPDSSNLHLWLIFQRDSLLFQRYNVVVLVLKAQTMLNSWLSAVVTCVSTLYAYYLLASENLCKRLASINLLFQNSSKGQKISRIQVRRANKFILPQIKWICCENIFSEKYSCTFAIAQPLRQCLNFKCEVFNQMLSQVNKGMQPRTSHFDR